MFRNVPACSGMFRVPGFIDGLVYMAAGIFHKKCGMSAAFVSACVNRALNVRSCFRFCAGRGSWGVSTGCQRLFMRGVRFLSSLYSSCRPLAENLSAYGRYRKEHPPAGSFALPKRPKRTLNHRQKRAHGGLECLTSVLCRLSSLQNRLSAGDTPIKPRLKVKQATRTTP